jgi:hypothetical protein
MNPKSVLFYIEPACFRNDPTFMRPWIHWISHLISNQQRHAPGWRFSLSSSPALCGLFKEYTQPLPVTTYELSARTVLASSDFNRFDYVKDLYGAGGRQAANTQLLDSLRVICQRESPDLVVSFTENRYLRQGFPNSRLLFCELGPLPRLGVAQTIFMDPCGHQPDSILNLAADRIIDLPVSRHLGDLERVWNRRVVTAIHAHPHFTGITAWLNALRATRRVALIALQPPDWPTYEGALDAVPVDNVLMRCLHELPEGWIGVPTYHPGYQLPREVEDRIAADFDMVRFPPSSLAVGHSEIFVPSVDGVITISSATGMAGLLHRKPVVTLGRSSIRSLAMTSIGDLAEGRGLDRNQRASLLAFLTHRYCHKLHDWVHTPGYFAAVAHGICGLSDPAEAYLDLDGWSPQKADDLLSSA